MSMSSSLLSIACATMLGLLGLAKGTNPTTTGTVEEVLYAPRGRYQTYGIARNSIMEGISFSSTDGEVAFPLYNCDNCHGFGRLLVSKYGNNFYAISFKPITRSIYSSPVNREDIKVYPDNVRALTPDGLTIVVDEFGKSILHP